MSAENGVSPAIASRHMALLERSAAEVLPGELGRLSESQAAQLAEDCSCAVSELQYGLFRRFIGPLLHPAGDATPKLTDETGDGDAEMQLDRVEGEDL